jgi:hypothetical protein
MLFGVLINLPATVRPEIAKLLASGSPTPTAAERHTTVSGYCNYQR